jgi:hypothetical protein
VQGGRTLQVGRTDDRTRRQPNREHAASTASANRLDESGG